MLVGPLDISYCLFFYILSIGNLIICFCLFIIFILNLKIVKKAKEISFLIILFFMMYFQNRLLYNMCNKDVILDIIETNETIDRLQNTLEQVTREQEQNLSRLNSLNTGLDTVSSNVNTTLETNKELLKKVIYHSETWKLMYPQIQTQYNILDSKLNTISKNTKPLEYKYTTNIVNK